MTFVCLVSWPPGLVRRHTHTAASSTWPRHSRGANWSVIITFFQTDSKETLSTENYQYLLLSQIVYYSHKITANTAKHWRSPWRWGWCWRCCRSCTASSWTRHTHNTPPTRLCSIGPDYSCLQPIPGSLSHKTDKQKFIFLTIYFVYYRHRWCVAHVFAGPLRVLDTRLAGAGHAVRHAPRIAARVTCQCKLSNLTPYLHVSAISPRSGSLAPNSSLYVQTRGSWQGLDTRVSRVCYVSRVTCVLCLTCPYLTGPSADSRSVQSEV